MPIFCAHLRMKHSMIYNCVLMIDQYSKSGPSYRYKLQGFMCLWISVYFFNINLWWGLMNSSLSGVYIVKYTSFVLFLCVVWFGGRRKHTLTSYLPCKERDLKAIKYITPYNNFKPSQCHFSFSHTCWKLSLKWLWSSWWQNSRISFPSRS